MSAPSKAPSKPGGIKTLVGVNGGYAAPENSHIVLHTESESVSVLVDRLEKFLQN